MRLNDIPALFSEGVEMEPHDPAKARWLNIEARKLRLRVTWPGIFGRLRDRLKSPPPAETRLRASH